MLFQEDFPANHSRLPGSEWAQQMTVTSGLSITGLSKNLGHLGLLEKMLLASSIWESTKCYLIWKAKGTKQGRLLYRLSPSMLPIEGIESGLLPTPTCNMVSGGANHNSPSVLAGKHGLNLSGALMKRNTKPLNAEVGGRLNPKWVEWLMGYPEGWTDLEHSETP